MNKKRSFSKTGLILVACMIVCLLLGLAVVPGGFGSDNKKDLDDENTPGIQEVLKDGSPLMIFDKRPEVKALIADFDEDQIKSVSATLSVDGDHGAVTVDAMNAGSQDEITAVYKALKNVIIGDQLEAGKSAEADCTVTFTLADGSTCDFAFENEEVYLLDGKRYAAGGTEGLWSVIQELIDE